MAYKDKHKVSALCSAGMERPDWLVGGRRGDPVLWPLPRTTSGRSTHTASCSSSSTRWRRPWSRARSCSTWVPWRSTSPGPRGVSIYLNVGGGGGTTRTASLPLPSSSSVLFSLVCTFSSTLCWLFRFAPRCSSCSPMSCSGHSGLFCSNPVHCVLPHSILIHSAPLLHCWTSLLPASLISLPRPPPYSSLSLPLYLSTSLLLLFSSSAVQDIRQLRLKQDGFIREISDLQETVEWKDKKIGVRPRGTANCLSQHSSFLFRFALSQNTLFAR